MRFLILLFCLVFSVRAGEKTRLQGHRRPAWDHMRPLGRMPRTNEMQVAIGLPLRQTQALNRLLQHLYDPAQPQYRHFLSPEEFTQSFGPTEEQYRQVIEFARTNGLRVRSIHPNRLMVGVSGSAAEIERAFGVSLEMFAHPSEPRIFYAPDADPALDPRLPVAHISGLDNYSRPRSYHQRKAQNLAAFNAVPRGGSGPTGSYLGDDFRRAYVPGTTLTGAGQSVGLFELEGYFASDITAYRNLANIPFITLTNVLIDGFNGVPTSTRPGSGNEEVALDIEMVAAMAPGLSRIIVYEGSPTASLATINHILNRMATDNLARQLSCSWGFDIDLLTRQIFQQYAAQGQSFFLASGDDGAFSGAVLQPSDDPYITVVGGTTLLTDSAGAWRAEHAWGFSGGGISTLYAIPPWQRGIDMTANLGSTTMRNVPDVAMCADDVWVTFSRGQSGSFLGTSIAAPLWAGFTALVNEEAAHRGRPSVGFLNPALYALGARAEATRFFHDITLGDNTTFESPDRFFAVPGYDLCTGWGTPTGTNLIAALLEAPSDPLVITSPLGFSTYARVGAPFSVTNQLFTLTNIGAVSIPWSVSNPVPWLEFSPVQGTLPPGASTAVTVTLNPSATGFALGAATAVARFLNQATGVTHEREFNLDLGNGGFEIGSFDGWALSGGIRNNFIVSIDNDSYTGASLLPGVPDESFAHSGTYGVFLGQTFSLGSLSRTLTTKPGQDYLLSFWLSNPLEGSPNQFRVTWNNSVLFDQTNLGPFAWTNFQYKVTAIGSTASLRFSFRNDQNAFALDEVILAPYTLPAPARIAAIRQDGAAIAIEAELPAGQTWQVQSLDNLSTGQWENLGEPLLGPQATFVDSPGSVRRFYRLISVP